MGRISTAAFGAALVFAAATGAAAQQTDAGHHRGRHGDRQSAATPAGRQGSLRGLFRGVNLTDAQKSQVKVIRERYQPQFKALRDSVRPAFEQARAARQRGDTLAARQAWAQTGGERQRMRELMQREAGEVRAILTPDQQKVFDQNVAAMRERVRDRMAGGRHEGRGRAGR
jgi:Spy/CpxP family protein refolding chaperone